MVVVEFFLYKVTAACDDKGVDLQAWMTKAKRSVKVSPEKTQFRYRIDFEPTKVAGRRTIVGAVVRTRPNKAFFNELKDGTIRSLHGLLPDAGGPGSGRYSGDLAWFLGIFHKGAFYAFVQQGYQLPGIGLIRLAIQESMPKTCKIEYTMELQKKQISEFKRALNRKLREATLGIRASGKTEKLGSDAAEDLLKRIGRTGNYNINLKVTLQQTKENKGVQTVKSFLGSLFGMDDASAILHEDLPTIFSSLRFSHFEGGPQDAISTNFLDYYKRVDFPEDLFLDDLDENHRTSLRAEIAEHVGEAKDKPDEADA